MNNDKKMDVVDWRDSAQHILSKNRAPHRFWPPTLIGLLGTLLLHSLIVPSALLASRARKTHFPEIQEAGARTKSNADASESLVLITLPTIANSNQEITKSISSLPTLSKLKPVPRVNPDPPAALNLEVLALGEDQASNSTVESGDGAEQARLFGLYTGQIQARIERIWRRPRTAVSDVDDRVAPTSAEESFRCQAQVVQDAGGNVQEILLPRCNGSPAWQHSLVIAIQQASPLPAAPSVSVFSHSIALDFVGLPYVVGSRDEDYEIEPKVSQTNEASLISTATTRPPRPTGAPKNPGSRN
jgi:hypothetical protein